MPSRFVRIGNAVALGAFILFLVSGVVMVVLWTAALARWIGWLGIVLGIFSAPLAVAYPFVHWIVEGNFPLVAFLVWLAGGMGMFASMLWVATGAAPAPRRGREPVSASEAARAVAGT